MAADSSTSRYADELIIGSRNGLVIVRGVVDDIDDTDDIAEMIGSARNQLRLMVGRARRR